METLKPVDVAIIGGGWTGLMMAKEITGRTGLTVAVLERGIPRKTADYVAGRMGNQDGIVVLCSRTSSANGSSTTVSEQLQTRPTVMADELLHAPLADPVEDRMVFFAVSPAFGNAKVSCPFVRKPPSKPIRRSRTPRPERRDPRRCVR